MQANLRFNIRDLSDKFLFEHICMGHNPYDTIIAAFFRMLTAV